MGFFDELNDMLDTANKVVGTANEVRDEVRDTKRSVDGIFSSIRNIRDSFDKDKEYEHSEEYRQDKAELERLEKRNNRVFLFFVLLNLFIIGSTIYLCVAGNPIVLQWLHIIK